MGGICKEGCAIRESLEGCEGNPRQERDEGTKEEKKDKGHGKGGQEDENYLETSEETEKEPNQRQ